MAYATRNRRPPRALTVEETARLLKVSGDHKDGFRDHLIFSFALGCALRESEIVALDVEDVAKRGLNGKLIPRRTLQLRVFKRGGGNADPTAQRVPVPDGTFYKLEKFLAVDGPTSGPLFVSRKRGRLSDRAVRSMFAKWQRAANFDHLYSFHHLRHSALTNAYRESGDIRKVQRLARHANLQTTTLYEHASDEEVSKAFRMLPS